MVRRWLVLAAAVAMAAAACGDGDAESGDANAVGDLTIQDAWARPTPGDGSNTAVYMTISNDGDTLDTLVAADGDACSVTELHMTTMEDDVMRMTPLEEGIALAPNSSVILGPGALHVMCMNVTDALEQGQTTNVTLDFANAGSVTVEATVRNEE